MINRVVLHVPSFVLVQKCPIRLLFLELFKDQHLKMADSSLFPLSLKDALVGASMKLQESFYQLWLCCSHQAWKSECCYGDAPTFLTILPRAILGAAINCT